MKISKNFRMDEFNVSASHPELAKGIPINIRPAIIALVTHVLQPICDRTGWSCYINSGYRSIELNRAVGGAQSSQHMKGEAADCVFMKDGKAVPIIDVLKVGKELCFDQMIAYPTFVHFSYTRLRANRKMVLYNSSYVGKRL